MKLSEMSQTVIANENSTSDSEIVANVREVKPTFSDMKIKVEKDGEEPMEDGKVDHQHRESRLTNIIDQLRCGKRRGHNNGEEINFNPNNGEAGGGGARRCARDASPPRAPPAQPAAPPAQPPHSLVKNERLSPTDNRSSGSRSRSVTPSTSSYPGTPPERGSPHAPAAAPPPPRNYSDIMRSLAARYNAPHANEYFHRINGFTSAQCPGPQTSPIRADVADQPVGGLFTKLAKQQGGPPRVPAFPVMFDMSSTKTLLALARVGRGGRLRRKRAGAGAAGAASGEHCPLDLSAATENAAKRMRLSASPSTRSDCDDRDERVEGRECLCAEARARLAAWTVDDVSDFVTSIDICAEYASNFREQRIDGSGLPLLTEDHLTGMLQMKLGPALKLRAVLSRKLEQCAQCQPNSCQAVTAANMPKINGSLKPEPRSNTTSPS